MPASQTITFLARRFEEAGVKLQHRHGQNFLIDLNLQRLIVDAAELGAFDVVLEVGTGTGALTALIAERAAAVVTVEIDPQLHQLASEELFGLDNVTLLQQDALHNKNTFAPTVLEAIGDALAAGPGRRFKLVANLPYSVATPVLTNLLACDLPLVSLTATIQKELADRIVARPGTKDYGALSVWVQSQCRAEVVRALPPSVFWPRPKVHSAIVRLTVDETLRRRIPDREFFHTFVRSLFFHRRKFLRSVLISACQEWLDKPQVDELLAELQLAPDRRAEQLDIDEMLALASAVRKRIREPAAVDRAHST